MSRRTSLIILAVVVLAAFVAAAAHAQLVITDKDYRVVKLDTSKNRIEVNKVEGNPDRCTAYIDVTSSTKVYLNGKPFDWKSIKKGWIIRARGGVRMDLGVNASKIVIISTSTPKTK